jgi:hypothetical protein
MPLPLETLVEEQPAFRTQEEVYEAIRRGCAGGGAAFHDLGQSEEGRPLYGVVMGTGPRTVSLVAGAHADEPVGPETLRTLILEGLRRPDHLDGLFEAYRFVIVPHVNPDGEARNRPWIEQWPGAEAYIQHRVRELPGRDIEFGYPAMRPENRIVASFLRAHAPMHLHMSLHGMGIAEGAMLLIERHWTFRTQPLRDAYAAAVTAAGLALHDHNRKGEKGFFYIEPGFTTTPEGDAMRTFFRAQGDLEMAARFHDSSMEYVRSLGGDPLCLVTELPLFTLRRDEADAAGSASAYRAFRAQLPDLVRRAQRGQDIGADLEAFGIRPVPLQTLKRLQLHTIALALEAL